MSGHRLETPKPTCLQVECYSGYRGEETPRSFRLRGRRFVVEEVLDCWLGPAHRYFKILADDNGVYILRHDCPRDRWELTMFAAREYLRRGPADPGQ